MGYSVWSAKFFISVLIALSSWSCGRGLEGNSAPSEFPSDDKGSGDGEDNDGTPDLPAPPSGTLDQNFGSEGIVRETLGENVSLRAMAVQSDGKILIAGSKKNASELALYVQRLNPDGTIDSGFGDSGILLFDRLSADDEAVGLAVLPDGKILIAGNTEEGTAENVVLIRSTSEGELDISFGNGGVVIYGQVNERETAGAVTFFDTGRAFKPVVVGKVFTGDSFLSLEYDEGGAPLAENTLDIGSGFGDSANAVLIDTSNRLVLAGQTEAGFAMARVTGPLGELDNLFNGTGKKIFGTEGCIANGIVESSGKYILAGKGKSGLTERFTLTRVEENGIVDTSFGTNGFLSPFEAEVQGQAYSIAADNSERIYAAGISREETDNGNFVVVRLTAAGDLDPAFADLGKLKIVLSSQLNIARAIAVQSDGKVLVAGHLGPPSADPTDLAIIRINP